MPSSLTPQEVSDLTGIRQHLHAHPELSNQERETSAFVAARLADLGLQPRTGVGGYGLMVDIPGASSGRTLAFRADMDGLPIEEQSDLPYRSQNPGVMHACGHDGHTTILLGTARSLLRARDRLAGSVRLIFQPAEENVGGAARMCRDGVMEGVDAVVGLHGWPGLEVGKIATRDGAMMASADTFDILVRGAQAHAAYPHLSHDPIVAGAQIVSALQPIVSREIDPADSVVVTVGQFHAGTAYNIIPQTALIQGTVRTLKASTRASMPERLERVASGIGHASRCEIEFTWHEGIGPVRNDWQINDLVRRVGVQLFGGDAVVELEHSSMGAEDFAAYLEHAPGAMFRLGLGDVTALHTPTFNFADAAIPIGVEMFVGIAESYLGSKLEQ